MKRGMIAITVLCICIAPAFAGPKEKDKAATHKECAECKTIHKDGMGWCDHCKAGMVCHVEVKDHKLYEAMKNSSYAKTLEKGESIKAAEIKCPDCKKLAEAHKDGYCAKCKGGLVAGHFYKGRESYDKAETAEKVMHEACKSKCETCGIAMVNDGKCDHCKLCYKEGKKVKC